MNATLVCDLSDTSFAVILSIFVSFFLCVLWRISRRWWYQSAWKYAWW